MRGLDYWFDSNSTPRTHVILCSSAGSMVKWLATVCGYYLLLQPIDVMIPFLYGQNNEHFGHLSSHYDLLPSKLMPIGYFV